MNILEISKSSSAKTEFSFFSVFFPSVFVFFNTDVGVGFGFLKISRYRFRFSVTDSALGYATAFNFWGFNLQKSAKASSMCGGSKCLC